MIHAPYKTIWSSATLPAQAQLPTLVENFKRQFDVGNDNVHALTSMPRRERRRQFNGGLRLFVESVAHDHRLRRVPAAASAPGVRPLQRASVAMVAAMAYWWEFYLHAID